MPSKEPMGVVESALNGGGEAFRLAVGSTVQQVKKMLAAQKESQSGLLAYNKAELGPFADGRIDVEQFTAVLPRHRVIDPTKLSVIERSLAVLQEVEQSLENVRQVSVRSGGSLGDAIQDALLQVGLAFGAARVVSLVKSDEYDAATHDGLLQGAPFRVWTKSERQVAPPVIINVEGRDIDAGVMARFLDAGMKFVLTSRGPCAPAPLVRLITPRTFVMQTDNPENLSALMQWHGPGVALVGEGCAIFTHDPSAGTQLQARLTVEALPKNPKQAIGGISVRQQLEELEQLATLASLTSATGLTLVPGGQKKKEAELPPDPADKLAAWLLNQARDI